MLPAILGVPSLSTWMLGSYLKTSHNHHTKKFVPTYNHDHLPFFSVLYNPLNWEAELNNLKIKEGVKTEACEGK
jgi:hypothetical protein